MAGQMRQQSPPNGLHAHLGPPAPHPQMNGHVPVQHPTVNRTRFTTLNENAWIGLGNISEGMGDLDGAIISYENALRHNPCSVPALNAISAIFRTKENFAKAVEYLQAILKLDGANGEVWGSLGHCYLMMEDLQQAYAAYQQALYHLRDPKEPKLWYGIGILYDRYGSLEHAEEAFSQVMRMQPDFEKANEIYFRLGIIYKQQQKFGQSLECFKYIVTDPPRPLTEEDIWFQIGHVYEQRKDYDSAKNAYRRVLDRDPNHAKVLQQLGWLHHQQSNSFSSQEQAIDYLVKSVTSDEQDAQSWYLLGRCYMSQQKYSKAYEAYQQAVYRDGRNPTFWCSIGVLYYQINQYRDALDAYSRAIRLNPYISEVWYDLGTLYESCNNQTNDALDAYQRAADLDPSNVHIKERLQLLRSGQATGMTNQHAAPAPQDVHPQTYQANNMAGPPGPQWNVQGHAHAHGPPNHVSAPQTDYSRRLAAIDNPQPQQLNPFDQRDPLRAPQPPPPPPPPPPPRQPSPRQDQMRPYQDQHRPNLGRRSPPPQQGPAPQAPSHGPPGYHNQALPQPSLPPQQPQPNRISNPNYGPPPNLGGHATPPAGHPGIMPPPNRGHSPPPEIKPLIGELPSGVPRDRNHAPYQHGGPVSGPAPPVHAAADPIREREDRDRMQTGYKRGPEPEDDYKVSNKKLANGDVRGRLDDLNYGRGSPVDRAGSPPGPKANGTSDARRDQPTSQAYHPSEAAHHPQDLPPINLQGHPSPSQQQGHISQQQPQQPQQQPPSTSAQTHAPPPPPPPPPPPQQAPQPPQQQSQPAPREQQPQNLPPMSSTPREERKMEHEPASRKMDLDEDYNDDGDEKPAPGSATRTSPPRALMNGQTKTEPQS